MLFLECFVMAVGGWRRAVRDVDRCQTRLSRWWRSIAGESLALGSPKHSQTCRFVGVTALTWRAPPVVRHSRRIRNRRYLPFTGKCSRILKLASDTMAPWGSLLLRVASNLGGRERRAVLKRRRILLQSFCRENSVSCGRCEVTVTVYLTA